MTIEGDQPVSPSPGPDVYRAIRQFDRAIFGGTGGPRPNAGQNLDTSNWEPWPAGPGLCDRCGKHVEERAQYVIFDREARTEEYVGRCQPCCDRDKWEKTISQLPPGPIVLWPEQIESVLAPDPASVPQWRPPDWEEWARAQRQLLLSPGRTDPYEEFGSCTASVNRGEFCGRPSIRHGLFGEHTCVTEEACKACGQEPGAANPCSECPK